MGQEGVGLNDGTVQTDVQPFLVILFQLSQAAQARTSWTVVRSLQVGVA